VKELHGRAPPQLLGKPILAATLTDVQVSKLALFSFNTIQGERKEFLLFTLTYLILAR
jgi:hypothetical protein